MAMYAVVAPGISAIYTNWKDVERIKSLYPYPKWQRVDSENQAEEWLRRNTYGWGLHTVNKYGNTMNDLYIDAKYQIFEDYLGIVYDTSKVGQVRIPETRNVVAYLGDKIHVKVPDIYLSNESITGHMSAIYNVLNLVGDIIDINIELPYYSIFYSLTGYSKGNLRSISTVKDMIRNRQGAVSYTIRLRELDAI